MFANLRRLTAMTAGCALFLTSMLLRPGMSAVGPPQARPSRVVIVKSDRAWQEYEQTSRVIASTLRASGQPLEIEETFLETEPERAAGFWSSLNNGHPDLIITVGTPASRAARRYANHIPLVFTLVLENPQTADSSQASAGSSGVTLLVPLQVQIQLIRQALPDARRVGLLYSRGNSALYAQAEKAAQALGLRLVEREVGSERDIPQALRSILSEVDVVWMPPDNMVYESRIIRFILLECFQYSVPIVAYSREVAEAGTPLALGVDYTDIGLQTAELVLRKLRGDSSAAGLVEAPRRVLLYVNDFVASSLDLNIPKAVRDKAIAVRNGGH